MLLDLNNTVAQLFNRVCRISWEDCMIGNEEEIEEECEWARTRPGVKQRHLALEDCPFRGEEGPLGCLTTSERKRYERYKELFPGQAVDVSNDPNVRPIYSKGSRLQTLLANQGLTMSPKHDRWLVCSELLTTMGFPITTDAVKMCGTACEFSRSLEPSSLRTRASCAKQVGNSMHINSIGAVHFSVAMKLVPLGLGCKVPTVSTRSASTSDKSQPSKFRKLVEAQKPTKKHEHSRKY